MHRPIADWPTTYADNSWVEVVHCGYSGHEGLTDESKMWFFAVAGSGVHLNIGRSLRVDVSWPAGDWPDFHEDGVDDAHKAMVQSRLDEAGEILGVNLAEYDSVQFPRWGGPASWGGEYFTEIVSLRLQPEASYIYQHLDSDILRCGPADALRPCRADDPVVLQMGSECSAPIGGAVERVARHSECRCIREHAEDCDD